MSTWKVTEADVGVGSTGSTGSIGALPVVTVTLLMLTGISRSTIYSRNELNVLSPCGGISTVYVAACVPVTVTVAVS